MTERVRIVEVHTDAVLVAPDPGENCVACTSPLCAAPSRCLRAVSGPDLDRSTLVPGASAEIEFSGRAGAAKGAVLTLIPLAMFLLLYFVPWSFVSVPSIASFTDEAVRGAFGVAGLLAGGLAGFLLARRIPEPAPVIVRVYEPADHASGSS
jgi:hypothetical protein